MKNKTNSISKIILCLFMSLIICYLTSITAINAANTPKISKTSLSINVGKSTTLTVSNANKAVKWSSGNSNIVKISKISGTKSCKATVKGLKSGATTVYAKIGSKKLSCKITVKAVKKTSSTVFITETGDKYHSRKSCPSLSRSKNIISISLSNAKARGYTACKRC